MFSLKKMRESKGFTIVELLIVIVVIGILATLVVTTYAGIQAKARDSKRQSDVKAIQTQLEAFYATNNYYPSTTDINDTAASGFRATKMRSLGADSVKDPSGTLATFRTTAPTSKNDKQYGYVPTVANAACTAAAAQCDAYALTAWLENTDAAYTKNNLD